MPFSIVTLLAVLALIMAAASAANWCPLWVPVVLLAVIALLGGLGVK